MGKAKQAKNFQRGISEGEQGLVNFASQSLKGREEEEMGMMLFELLPEFFNGVIVRGVSGELVDGKAISVGGEELSHCGGGMIASAILNQDNMLVSLSQDLGEKVGIGG